MSDKTKVFFDSNILVYFADGADPKKQQIAENLIKNAVINDNGVISTQSLQEFFCRHNTKTSLHQRKSKGVYRKLFRIFYSRTNLGHTHLKGRRHLYKKSILILGFAHSCRRNSIRLRNLLFQRSYKRSTCRRCKDCESVCNIVF